MAYNYTNLENMIPVFGARPNVMCSHPTNFNHMAAAITTAAVGVNATPTSTTSITSLVANAKRERTPEPPPAPKLSYLASPTMKPNQGTAPMDVENDSETESTTARPTPTVNPQITPKPLGGKCAHMQMHDPNIFLNGLMSNTGLNSGYMFFPTAAAATAATSAAPAGSMLMDPTAIMAAAMRQMQQSYTGYTLPSAEGVGVDCTAAQAGVAEAYPAGTGLNMKEVIKTKNCILFPPNPNAQSPTIRDRPPGCRTVFVGGLPENISDEIVREIFEACGEITTLRMSKKNFCHIRYRHEVSIDRAIYLSGYRVRISNMTEPANFGRLHVDYAQARDDQYDYECKQRQLQREQRHRERLSLDRLRSQSPPPIQHYTDHEASVVAESLRNNDTFVKAIQTIAVWLERGDCTKRNANVFYSMIQSTHAHVRRLYTDKQQLEADLRKARESYRKQMLTMSTQFTQIEKVFSAASHKKVWDHFTKAQRKNIDQWKKLATELRSVHIEDDEMEVSDDDRDYHSSSIGSVKRARYDSENLKEENDSLRCQLEAIRNEMSLERTDIKYDCDFREKQIKVLQETIRNMQTQLLQTKIQEQKDAKTIENLEQKLKAAGVKQLLLNTKIKESSKRLRGKEACSSVNSETSEILVDEHDAAEDATKEAPEVKQPEQEKKKAKETTKDMNKHIQDYLQIIDIDMYKSDDDVKIIEEPPHVMKVSEVEVNIEKEPENSAIVLDTKPVEKALDKQEEKEKLPLEVITLNAEQNEKENIEEKEQTLELLKEASVKEAQLNSQELFEAKVIALTSAFLVVQPFGVRTAAISSYLSTLMTSYELTAPALVVVLQKYPNIFEAMQEGMSIDDKWKFCGFPAASPKSVNEVVPLK